MKYLQDCICSQILALQIPLAAKRAIAAALMWRNHVDIWPPRSLQWEFQSSLNQFYPLISQVRSFPTALNFNIMETSYIWLCQALVPDMAINGSFFSEHLYADVVLQCICNPLQVASPIEDLKSAFKDFDPSISKMLCKASPSEELATYLKQNVLQTRRNSGAIQATSPTIEREFFMAICIYLFVSNHCTALIDQCTDLNIDSGMWYPFYLRTSSQTRI